MAPEFDFEQFMAKVKEAAQRVSPLFQVAAAGEDLCLITLPGMSNQVWVKAALDGEKFRVYKSRVKDPQPTHLGQIAPVGEQFLSEVLRNYMGEMGKV